jgi:Protein of unknown function (DUF817)
VADLRSAALLWRPLALFVEVEARLSAWVAQRPLTAALYEFVRFGVKQAWACLFAAMMLALLIGSHAFYPKTAPLARYDFLVLAALTVQAGMLLARLETFEEAKVIFVFHLVGTAMEVFKTATGSWVYPEPSLIRIGGVPLFTGFMYDRGQDLRRNARRQSLMSSCLRTASHRPLPISFRPPRCGRIDRRPASLDHSLKVTKGSSPGKNAFSRRTPRASNR